MQSENKYFNESFIQKKYKKANKCMDDMQLRSNIRHIRVNENNLSLKQ